MVQRAAAHLELARGRSPQPHRQRRHRRDGAARPSEGPDARHAREGDARVPFDQGRRLAGGIPGARFVPLPSRNHLILENEPAFPRFLQEIKSFLASTPERAA